MSALIVRLIAFVVAMFALASATPAPAAIGTCKIRGPRWDLYGIHNGKHRSGRKYLITHQNLGCAKARDYLREIFEHLPAKPKGPVDGPGGYDCRGTWSGDRRNRTFSGSCSADGPNPLRPWEDAKRFSWDPWFPTG